MRALALSETTSGTSRVPTTSQVLSKVHGTVSSPLATGGAGDRFEQRVDAYALTLLLTGSRAPIITDSIVVEVHLQTKHLGWRTDDLLIVGEARPGVRRRVAIQSKRSFTIA